MKEAVVYLSIILFFREEYARGGSQLFFGLGAAVQTDRVHYSGPGTVGSDDKTRTGFTASIGLNVPVASQIDVTGTFRYITLPEVDFKIPGTVPIKSDSFIGTLGLTWHAEVM